MILMACSVLPEFSSDHQTIEASKVGLVTVVPSEIDSTRTSYMTRNKKEIRELVDALNSGARAGMYKGAYWTEIRLKTADSTMVLYTDGTVFGNSHSGRFYKLDNVSIIRKYFKQP
jgi:hypothetical protein